MRCRGASTSLPSRPSSRSGSQQAFGNGGGWRPNMYYVELLRVSRALLVAMAWLAVPLAINLIILGSHVGSASLGSVPLTTVFAIAGIAASVFATSIGGSLSCENEGH